MILRSAYEPKYIRLVLKAHCAIQGLGAEPAEGCAAFVSGYCVQTMVSVVEEM